MYCTKKITDDLTWVGGNDRRLAMFEGVYSVPDGVSYNSYLLTDEKTVLLDTVDKAVAKVFFENLEYVLGGRGLDYLVVQHMEPDHTATLQELVLRHPEVTVVCNKLTLKMIKQFFDFDIDSRVMIVEEGGTLNTGRHELTFYMAPMVHWPEVMVTYDKTDKALFSADAFGTFGAMNGAIFADEVDFMRDYLDESRRYYANIVGKYGPQVQALLKKMSALDIELLCPLHGFVWRESIGDYVAKYEKWSAYTPEVTGVLIAYASIYGNTENAAEIISSKLRNEGIRTVMFDVSVTPASEIVAAAFKYSHLVFASSTYNTGIFVTMDALLRDLAAHNIQNRTIALVQNGSWAPASGKLMREILEPLKNVNILEETPTIKSSLKESQIGEIDTLVAAISATIPEHDRTLVPVKAGEIEKTAFFRLSYGLFVLTARDGKKDNGCIINTAVQITDSPKRISIALNKSNYTHGMIMKTGKFNISVLSEDVPFEDFGRFGFQSGRDTDKFENDDKSVRSENGIFYITEHTNAFMSCRVVSTVDLGSHTMFIAEVTQAKVLSDLKSVTYAYYQQNIKPKAKPSDGKVTRWVCTVCGYIYEGDELPPDFICPVCKHGAEVFKKL